MFDAATDKLVGAHFVGMNVTEMIAEPTVAKALSATAEVLAHTIHPHPTLSEVMWEAADDLLGLCCHTPKPETE